MNQSHGGAITRSGDATTDWSAVAMSRPRLGFLYVLTVPWIAAASMICGIRIGGLNYTGFLWLFALAVGVLLVLIEKSLRPDTLVRFALAPWLVWMGYMWLSLLWVEESGELPAIIQYVMQMQMPLLVAIAASIFVRTRAQLEQLVASYFYSLWILTALVGLVLAKVLTQDDLADVYVAVRALAITCIVIASLAVARMRSNPLQGWFLWGVCLALAAVTGGRVASLTILLLPVFNPAVRSPWRKAGVLLGIALVGLGIFFTPTFQERFFLEKGGSASDVLSGDFDSAGRFDVWPQVLDRALDHPWLGHGVGTIQFYIPTIWMHQSHPHNDYLRVGYELGMIGVVLFFSIWIWQLFKLGRMVRSTDGVVQQVFAAVWMSFIGFLIMASTDNVIVYHVWFMNPLFALFGAAYAVAALEREARQHADTAAGSVTA